MSDFVERLCLQCGMCCNGMLFADVRPEPGDRSPLFAGRARVPQPCPAFQSGDCTCAIYKERPQRCRKFACRQLLAVEVGEATVPQALCKIAKARRLGRLLEKELAALGFNNLKLPLKRRFQQCQRAAEQGSLDASHFARLGKIQLAMHQLNLLLTGEFLQ